MEQRDAAAMAGQGGLHAVMPVQVERLATECVATQVQHRVASNSGQNEGRVRPAQSPDVPHTPLRSPAVSAPTTPEPPPSSSHAALGVATEESDVDETPTSLVEIYQDECCYVYAIALPFGVSAPPRWAWP